MSGKPNIRCPSCEEIYPVDLLPRRRLRRNEFGIDIFSCPRCSQPIKVDPYECLSASELIATGAAPDGMAIGAYGEFEKIPPESNADKASDNVFGPFSDDSSDEYRLANMAYTFIAMQIELASGMRRGWTGRDRYRRARDAFARGYVMGFCDAILQVKGIDDEVRCAAFCASVFVRLFGQREGAKLAGIALKEMGSGAAFSGQGRGGNDFMDWRRAAGEVDKAPPPSGLFRYIAGRT